MNARRRTQQFVAAFVISGIVIAALCGFVLVDLSTERFMPGEAAPLFDISSVSAQGMSVAVLGQWYDVDSAAFDPGRRTIWEHRNWMPSSVRVVGILVARGYTAVRDHLDRAKPPEEPW